MLIKNTTETGMPNSKVSKALEQAKELVAALETYDDTPASRLAVLKQTDRIRNTMQKPIDIVTHSLEQLSLAGAMHIILGTKAYHATPADGRPIHADTLAHITNVASTVIHRTYRVAINHGIFIQTEKDAYAHNDLSRALGPKHLGAHLILNLEIMRGWIHLPDYLKSHEPSDVFDRLKSPGVYSFGKEHLGKTYHEILEEDPDEERREIWDTAMSMVNQPVEGMFPFVSLKENVEKDPNRPFLVDVGAGRAQSCFAIQKEIGGIFKAQFVVQDLPGVIDKMKPEDYPGMELMAYDAYTAQPVKNAHIYFLRQFLHDFYDPDAIPILKNTASAMGPDSRLIICEMLLPDRVEPHENRDTYWMDLAMLVVGGQERTKEQMASMLDNAGLELVKVWRSSRGRTAMFEAKLRG